MLAAFCLLLTKEPGLSQNLVTNGGFAGASIAGWVGNPPYTGYVGEPGSSSGGRGDWIGLGGVMYQDLPTVPGQNYLLSFAVQGDDPGQSYRISNLKVYWGAQLVAWYTMPNYPQWYFPKYVLLATNSPMRLRFEGAGYAGLDNVSVTVAPLTQPLVEITSPTNGARFTMDDNIVFSANAFTSNGTITRVEYYHAGINLIGSSTNPPYLVTWSNVPAGNFVISAKATSSANSATISTAVPIVVSTRPLVRIDSPLPEAVFTNGGNITIRAAVLNNDGRLTTLEFYQETNLLRTIGGITGNPVQNVTWSNVAQGNYTLHVVGKDSSGGILSASNVVVHVMPPAIQDQTQTAWGARVAVNRSLSVAQTFTPEINGRLHHIDIAADADATYDGAPLIATIVNATNGVPGSNVLGTGILLGAYLYSAPSIYFPSNEIFLKAEQQYAAVFSSATAPGVNISFHTSYPTDSYRGGMLWQRAPGGAWQPVTYFGDPTTNSDLAFTTFFSPNTPPAVSLDSPPNGARFAVGEPIPLAATASDPDDTVARVEFYSDAGLVGTSETRPYSFILSNAPAGNFIITARAVDSHGAATVSTPASILVGPDNGRPAITISDANVAEGQSGSRDAVFTVRLSAPALQAVAVNYATANGTAISPVDYSGRTGVLIFPPGVTSQTLAIPVLGDGVNELNEIFFVNLSRATNAIIQDSQGVGTIVDDELGAGKAHHFEWLPPGTQPVVGRPFGAGLVARDLLNSNVNEVVGPVCFSLAAATANTNNPVIGNNPPTVSHNFFSLTSGYAFTPTVDILVTHFRYYCGTKVSLWADDGTLLATANVTALPAGWRETKLVAPVSLKAGGRYRLTFYSGGQPYYSRSDYANSFQHGTINWAYFIGADAFPTETDSSHWPSVDLRYTLESVLANAVEPACAAHFTNGAWTGPLVLKVGGSVYLRAEDGFGHLGLSAPFNVTVPPAVSLSSPANGSSFAFPGSFPISAAATPGSNPLVGVGFFQGTSLLAQDAQPPYTFSWTNVPLGSYLLTGVVTDSLGISSTSAPVNISVVFVNQPPSFTKGSDPSVLEDAGPQLVIGWATDIAPGPAYESNQTVTFQLSNNRSDLFSAAPAVDATGTLTFTPATNANGVATVTVILKDNGGTDNGGHDTSTPQTFRITIFPVNDPPAAQSQSVALDEDSTAAITLGAFDVDGDPITFTVGPPAHGTLTGTPPNLSYRPATNYFGPDSFTFRVSDGETNSQTATVSLTVRPVNDPPVAKIAVSPLVELPGITNRVVIAPVCANAAVVLDGSESSDVEHDPLEYFWIEGTNVLASGVTVTNEFEPGTHELALLVSDGTATTRGTVTVEVVAPSESVAALILFIAEAPLDRHEIKPLSHPLQEAMKDMDHCKAKSAVKDLREFQKELKKIEKRHPALAAQLLAAAQTILDAVDDEKKTRHHEPPQVVTTQ